MLHSRTNQPNPKAETYSTKTKRKQDHRCYIQGQISQIQRQRHIQRKPKENKITDATFKDKSAKSKGRDIFNENQKKTRSPMLHSRTNQPNPKAETYSTKTK